MQILANYYVMFTKCWGDVKKDIVASSKGAEDGQEGWNGFIEKAARELKREHQKAFSRQATG